MVAKISPNCRIRYPKHFKVSHDSIIDDFCYFSTKIQIGEFCHIASGCTIAGGKNYSFTLGNFSSISSGVRIWCNSNDFVNDLIILKTKNVAIEDAPITGNVTLGNMCGIGANSVIMPANNIPDGVAIGALSFVPPRFKFKSWSVYAGVPIKFIKKRNKKTVLKQIQKIQSQS